MPSSYVPGLDITFWINIPDKQQYHNSPSSAKSRKATNPISMKRPMSTPRADYTTTSTNDYARPTNPSESRMAYSKR